MWIIFSCLVLRYVYLNIFMLIVGCFILYCMWCGIVFWCLFCNMVWVWWWLGIGCLGVICCRCVIVDCILWNVRMILNFIYLVLIIGWGGGWIKWFYVVVVWDVVLWVVGFCVLLLVEVVWFCNVWLIFLIVYCFVLWNWRVWFMEYRFVIYCIR